MTLTGMVPPRCSTASLAQLSVDSALPHCRLHKEAFNHAWRTVFNLDTDIDSMKHHGLTDPLILVSMLEHHGTPRQEVRRRS